MDNFLKEGVDISGRAFAGDAHYFDDIASPNVIREHLNSTKVFSVYVRL